MKSGKLKNNPIKEKSFKFAVQIVRLYKYMTSSTNFNKEFILSKQIVRCGTSIGANVNEAQQAQSKKDFLMKMNIALKECSETKYWLELLYETEYITEKQMQELSGDCVELEKLLTSIVKTTSTTIT